MKKKRKISYAHTIKYNEKLSETKLNNNFPVRMEHPNPASVWLGDLYCTVEQWDDANIQGQFLYKFLAFIVRRDLNNNNQMH